MNALQRGIILARNEEKKNHYDNTVEIFKVAYNKIKAITERFIIKLNKIAESEYFSEKTLRKTVLRYLLIIHDIRYDILDQYAYKFDTSSITRYQRDRERDEDVIRQDMRRLLEMSFGEIVNKQGPREWYNSVRPHPFRDQVEVWIQSRVKNRNFNSISQEIQQNFIWFMENLIRTLIYEDHVTDFITQSRYIYKSFASQLDMMISTIIFIIYKINNRNFSQRELAATKLQAARRGQLARRNL